MNDFDAIVHDLYNKPIARDDGRYLTYRDLILSVLLRRFAQDTAQTLQARYDLAKRIVHTKRADLHHHDIALILQCASAIVDPLLWGRLRDFLFALSADDNSDHEHNELL